MIKRIEKSRTEEMEQEQVWQSQNITEMRLRWLGHVERKIEEDHSNENMEDGSWWTPKDRKIETEVKRCYTKRHKRVHTKHKTGEDIERNLDAPTQNREKAEKEEDNKQEQCKMSELNREQKDHCLQIYKEIS